MGLDPYVPVRIYRRHLPHWRQDGATYFVTFRLHDSIPRAVMADWISRRKSWERAHGLSGDLPEREWLVRYQAIPEVTRRAYERRLATQLLTELDKCHGQCYMRDATCRTIVREALRHFDHVRLDCGDYAIMPNHVHWLIRPRSAVELSDVLKSIKQYSSRRLNELLGRSGVLWQKDSFDRLVRDRKELTKIRSYIGNNPRKARLNSGEYELYRADWL